VALEGLPVRAELQLATQYALTEINVRKRRQGLWGGENAGHVAVPQDELNQPARLKMHLAFGCKKFVRKKAKRPPKVISIQRRPFAYALLTGCRDNATAQNP